MKFTRTSDSKYIWEVPKTFNVHPLALAHVKGRYCLTGKDGKTYLEFWDGLLVIYKGYQFDGCTMSPDCKRALRGCCVHDALYQILRSFPEVFTYANADDVMLEMHREDRFWLRKVYHWVLQKYNTHIKKRQ